MFVVLPYQTVVQSFVFIERTVYKELKRYVFLNLCSFCFCNIFMLPLKKTVNCLTHFLLIVFIFVLFYFALNLLLGENDHSLVIIFFIQLEKKKKKRKKKRRRRDYNLYMLQHWEINYTKRWNCIWCYLLFGCNWLGFLSWSMLYVMDGQLWLTWVYRVWVCWGNCQG